MAQIFERVQNLSTKVIEDKKAMDAISDKQSCLQTRLEKIEQKVNKTTNDVSRMSTNQMIIDDGLSRISRIL